MKIEKFDRFGDGRVTLTCYISDTIMETMHKGPKSGVLIFPGGGYKYCSTREAEPIALEFVGDGHLAFVLIYSTDYSPLGTDPLTDALWAMALIREHAEEWNLDSNKIAVMGFSAGGHLAATLGVHYNDESVYGPMGLCEAQVKPNALILCYPVLLTGEHGHKGSAEHLCDNNSKYNLDYFSLEKHVDKHVPPCFMWHTFTDATVPIQNTTVFAQKLADNGIPFEYHVFPQGHHGLSTASKTTATKPEGINRHVNHWLELCKEWLEIVFG